MYRHLQPLYVISCTAQQRAKEAEQRATPNEQRATAATQRAVTAEQRAATNEQRVTAAEERASTADKRAIAAMQRANTNEHRAITAEQRATTAERELLRVNEHIEGAEQRAREAEQGATMADLRATVAEQRVTIAEQEIQRASEHFRGEVQAANERAEQWVRETERRARDAEHRASESDRRAREADALARTEISGLTRLLQRQAVTPPTDPPHWAVGRNEIEMTEEELGRGGWGVVKVASFRGLRVAAKCLYGEILNAHNRQLFTREMNMAARAHHPHLLQFIGATMEGEPVILTELMPTSLRAVLEQGPLTRQQIISIATQVAQALNYLHLMRPDPIIHRDISSANVLLEPMGPNQWRAKVSDYGSVNFQRQVTTVGPGNPTYAAPESHNPRQQSPKMDVFSFGILLLEMASGQLPAEADRARLLQAILWVGLRQLIEDCIRDDPRPRPSMQNILGTLSHM